MVATFAWACATVMPGLSLPMTISQRLPRSVSEKCGRATESFIITGVQTSSAKPAYVLAKSFGVTPMMVKVCSFSVSLHSEDVKVIARHDGAPHAFRLPAVAHVERKDLMRDDARKRLVAVAEVQVIDVRVRERGVVL